MMWYYFNEIAITGIFDDLFSIFCDVVLYWMITRLWLKPILEKVDPWT